MVKVGLGINLNDKKVMEKLNQTITEEFVHVISSEQLETLLNLVANNETGYGTIIVRVTGGYINSNPAIYEHEEFEAYISTKKNKETEMIEETFNIDDTTGEKGDFSWDNLNVAQIYLNTWSNVCRIYFHETYESIEIEYQDIDIAAEDLEV